MNKVITYEIVTKAEEEFINITGLVRNSVKDSGVKNGIVLIASNHTTCGVTINENADKYVTRDISMILDKVFPKNENYKHPEGNSNAHIKTSFMGTSKEVIIEDGNLLLGKWQCIFLCEFDGPRKRIVNIKIIEG